MRRAQAQALFGGFLGALAIFAVLFWLVGVDRILGVLAGANLRYVVVVAAAELTWLVMWSLSLRTVLRILGVELTVLSSFLVFSGVTFLNNITPFGQAGGEPAGALLVGRESSAEYETGLAALTTVDALNFVPSITIALVGIGYYATTVSITDQLEVAVTAAVAFAVAVPLVVGVIWRHRYGIERRIVRVLTPLIRKVSAVLPRVTPPSVEGIQSRVEGFFRAIERIATDRRGVTVALGFSALGWGAQMVGLWFAFQALDASIPLPVAMFVIPMSTMAAVTPLPGGLGGIESLQIGLLLSLTGVPVPTVVGAVVIHRVGGFWLAMLTGGGSLAALGTNSI